MRRQPGPAAFPYQAPYPTSHTHPCPTVCSLRLRLPMRRRYTRREIHAADIGMERQLLESRFKRPFVLVALHVGIAQVHELLVRVDVGPCGMTRAERRVVGEAEGCPEACHVLIVLLVLQVYVRSKTHFAPSRAWTSGTIPGCTVICRPGRGTLGSDRPILAVDTAGQLAPHVWLRAAGSIELTPTMSFCRD